MPKLLMLNHNVVWRSTFNRCYKFGRELVSRGWEVDIFTISPSRRLRGPDRHVVHGVGIVEFPDLFTGSLRSGWDPYDTMRRIMRVVTGGYDMVWAFEGRPVVSLPALALEFARDVPQVTDWTDWWGRGGAIRQRRNFMMLSRVFSPVETFFEEAFRRRARAVTTISSTITDRAHRHGFADDRIGIVRTPADTVSITPGDKSAMRRRFGIPGTSPVVALSGFTHYDLDLAMQTFSRFRRKRRDAVMITTGSMPDLAGTPFAGLLTEGAVSSFGSLARGDLGDVLAMSDVFLMPMSDTLANRARFPARFGDHCAAGRPIITNPVGDIPLLFEGRDIGLMVEPTPEAMAAAIGELIGDPVRLERLGAQARILAETELSPATCTDTLLSFWRSIPELGTLIER